MIQEKNNNESTAPIKKIAFLLLGWFCLALGFAGIFLPLLPTVPLWLVSAWSFSIASKRWHSWLIHHPRFGPVIRYWQDGDGIPVKIKTRAIIVIWISLIISMIVIKKIWLSLILIGIGCGVSFYLIRLPTRK